ncbi:WAT1-related protein At3g28050-like isoform X1 [Actinidia eriantha]|uniref:WAT1-related protein At3g28050-like isoform X1 n=1 Tax=Actinidia eriantha TaxID=165200 RepID=UPI0025841194|nr:WAT1-related protein At3g28050-like isoform X1 [Actinidia eriantha]
MVATECLEAGLSTLSKAAMVKGMSDFVFVTYSNALALLFLLPSTFIYYSRKRPCPRLPFSIVCRIFILGLISCSLQILMYAGIGYSSPTMWSAMNGLIPAFTFLLAIVTRMEKLDLKVWSSQAKSIGTIVTVVGAYIVIFYQGPPIIFYQSFPNLDALILSPLSNWIIGGFLLATSSFLISLLSIVQTWIIRDYPAELVVTLLGCIFVTILSTIVALLAERDPNAWKLRPDVELVTIAYSAIFLVSIRSVVHAWACRTKGPVFVTVFKPLGMVFTVAMGVSFLRDTLHIGSVIGAATIAVGFYSVMWGKFNEVMNIEDSGIPGLDSSTDNVPLLQNKSMDV